MAVNKTVSALSIALIVFVMLTFILAVTTYIFFKKWMDEVDLVKAETDKAQAAASDLATAKDDVTKLKQIIGAGDEDAVDVVEASANEIFQRDFAGFQEEPKSFLKLTAWIRGEFRRRAEDARKADEQRKAEAAAAETARAGEQAAKTKAEQDVAAAKQQQTAAKQAFDTQWQGHESEQKKLLEQKQDAEKNAALLDLVLTEIDKFEDRLPPNRRQAFAGKDRKGEVTDRLKIVSDELRDRAEAIGRQNELLAKLRVPEGFVINDRVRPGDTLQNVLRDSIPADDRIDGFDGRVISVDPAAASVLISCPSTRGLRPGLVLSVFDPGEDRPQSGDRKAVVEVTEVEGQSLARAKIRQDSVRRPILAGDGVASSLWAAGMSPEVVIVGYVNLDDAGGPDLQRLTDLVTRAGARVADAVSPATALVVDAGKPPSSVGDSASGWRANDARRQATAVETARKTRVPVVGIDSLLEMLGLTRASVVDDGLPTPVATR
jgi:hypothetical protein